MNVPIASLVSNEIAKILMLPEHTRLLLVGQTIAPPQIYHIGCADVSVGLESNLT